MAAYRFCRSDDVPLLVRAYNECYRPHFPDLPQLTVEGFKLWIRRLDLWTSSCMVATEGDRLIAVLLAAKRETANLIWAVGVHPEFQRRGHGRHLLDSLGQKLAILGPPRILAEVPADWRHARSFFEACGYEADSEYVDYFLQMRPATPEAADFVVPIRFDELAESGGLDDPGPRCWERDRKSLLNRKREIEGLAVVSDERIEAYLLYHEPDLRGTREILEFGCAREDRRDALLSLLLTTYASRGDDPVYLRRAHADEIASALLEALGFRSAARCVGYAAKATTG